MKTLVGVISVFLHCSSPYQRISSEPVPKGITVEPETQLSAESSAPKAKRIREILNGVLQAKLKNNPNQKIDEYRKYVETLRFNFSAYISTPDTDRNPDSICKQQKIKNQLKPRYVEDHPREYSCFGLTGLSVVCLDRTIAARAQQEQKEWFKPLLGEIASYEALQRFGEAARIYEYLSDHCQAERYKDACNTEEIIALTPPGDLSQLANHYQ
mgnify:FL=1